MNDQLKKDIVNQLIADITKNRTADHPTNMHIFTFPIELIKAGS